MDDMKNPGYAKRVANWYMNWLFDRCWTVKDTLIAWNWGIGNWRRWKERNQANETAWNVPSVHPYGEDSFDLSYDQMADDKLPKTTQDYLKKYEKLTGEKP